MLSDLLEGSDPGGFIIIQGKYLNVEMNSQLVTVGHGQKSPCNLYVHC